MNCRAALIPLLPCLMLAACNKSSEPSPGNALTSPVNTAPATVVAGKAAGAAVPGTMAKLLESDNIGRRIDIFERTAGAPTDATATSSTYAVDGCSVTVQTKDKAITWISLQLDSGKCTVDLAPLLQTKRLVTPTKPLTYGELEKLMGEQAEYYAPCMSSNCGNAFEPYFEAVFPGVHANDWIDTVATSLQSSDGTEKQVDAWVDQLTKVAGQDFIDNARVDCDRKHDALASAALATATVESIGFGHRDDPYEKDCHSTASP